MRRGFVPGFVNYKKGRTRLAAASDKVYQLLAHCRFYQGTLDSSTTKTGHHDIAENDVKTPKNKSIFFGHYMASNYIFWYLQIVHIVRDVIVNADNI